MPDVKVLHMADMHLQWPFAAMGADGHQGRRRREELKDVFVRIIDLAAQEQVQVLLIAGDLFEHKYATRGLIKFIDDQFRRIPGTRVFISPGNHDPYLPGSYYEEYPWAENVHVFGPQPARVDLDGLPVSVYGWGFGTWEVRQPMLRGLQAEDPTRINLAVFHGGEGAYHPFQASDLAALGADYIALGHIHKEGVMLRKNGRVVARYSGSPEALSFGEPGEHGVYLGVVDKLSNRMEFVPTGYRRYISGQVDVSGAVSLEDLVNAIRQVDTPERRAQHCYRLTLTGGIDAGLTPDLPVLLDRLAGEFYFLKLADETRPDYDLERLAQERSARGLFVQKLTAMEAETEDPVIRSRIRRALAVGLEAFHVRGGAR